MIDVIVIGAGPAGVLAALRAAELGARTVLVARGEFGGMAANDGPVPVRVLARAARLIREARQFNEFGLTAYKPALDYPRLLERVREVVTDVRAHSALRDQLETSGVTIHENAGAARFADQHIIETGSGLQLQADRIVICTGGVSRRLPIPGFELTSTHSDAWRLTEVPPSMLVIGSGATGVQVASIFNAFGSRIQLFEAGPRIVPSEDEDVSTAVAAAFRASGMVVRENFGTIESFERSPTGVRMNFSKDGQRGAAEAALAVVAVGWAANTADLNLAAAGVETEQHGFVKVDEYLQTSVSHIFAGGDITGRLMLVPQALQAGFVAATNALVGPTLPFQDEVNPIGSFTDPEYAQVGMTEKKARERCDVVTGVIRFDATTRMIIDGHKFGFCKLIVDRKTCKIIGCHVVGEQAVEIIQMAAIAMAAQMRVDDLARVPLSYPTYAGILSRVSAVAAQKLGLDFRWPGHSSENHELLHQ
jgi:dihydrolipoamide dehydrogenase